MNRKRFEYLGGERASGKPDAVRDHTRRKLTAEINKVLDLPPETPRHIVLLTEFYNGDEVYRQVSAMGLEIPDIAGALIQHTTTFVAGELLKLRNGQSTAGQSMDLIMAYIRAKQDSYKFWMQFSKEHGRGKPFDL